MPHYERMRDGNTVVVGCLRLRAGSVHGGRDGSGAHAVSAEYVTATSFRHWASSLRWAACCARRTIASAAARGAVLSWSYWNTRFAADPAIVGRQITVNSVPVTVVGVAAKKLSRARSGGASEICGCRRHGADDRAPSQRQSGRLFIAMMARLKSGVSIEQATAEMRVLDRPVSRTWRASLQLADG
jgi:hypothetical protein